MYDKLLHKQNSRLCKLSIIANYKVNSAFPASGDYFLSLNANNSVQVRVDVKAYVVLQRSKVQ